MRLRLGRGAAVWLACRSECGGVAVVSSARFARLPLPFVLWPLLWFETFITRRKEFLSISKQTVAACACFVSRLSRENAACASASRWHVPFCPASLVCTHSTRGRLFHCAVRLGGLFRNRTVAASCTIYFYPTKYLVNEPLVANELVEILVLDL